MATWTPWGTADYREKLAPGITFYGTPGHGGYKLSKGRNERMPDYMKDDHNTRAGWYEEDCEWAKVVTVFWQDFPPTLRAQAKGSLKGWFPDAYERFYGVTLMPGESYKRDQQLFEQAHKGDMVVVSCAGSWQKSVPDGYVLATATLGGNRLGARREFLVPTAEYKQRGRFGFVIDSARHQEITA